MENQHLQEKKWYNNFSVKMIILGLLGLLLLIPLQMVKNIIRERALYADETRTEIGDLWAHKQTITGPVLNIPCKKHNYKDGKFLISTLHILPEKLMIEAVVKPEIRYRGIYETVVYETEINLEGAFCLEDIANTNTDEYNWDQAYISLGVSDNKGLIGNILLHLDNFTIEAKPGTVQTDIFSSGITFPVNVSTPNSGEFKGLFRINIGLKGSEGIYFSPVGKNTNVKIKSSWPTPSFQGNFIPDEKEINDEGFIASWLITHLNRNFPQAWVGGGFLPENDSFGVNLMVEVDHYKKAERSAKYGLLFILLTFFVLLIIEIRSLERIHIFYYILVALALILFFSLLNALSEKLGFNLSYLISSVATISLLGTFFNSLLKKGWIIVVVSGTLSILYGFIFILLAMKDYAYLVGNIGLFLLLGILMIISSKYRIF